eukprot:Sspe_Gene.63901::Locus_37136_Transcript_1_1_Confidence_1.000_Length_1019::g.63901::m.63901
MHPHDVGAGCIGECTLVESMRGVLGGWEGVVTEVVEDCMGYMVLVAGVAHIVCPWKASTVAVGWGTARTLGTWLQWVLQVGRPFWVLPSPSACAAAVVGWGMPSTSAVCHAFVLTSLRAWWYGVVVLLSAAADILSLSHWPSAVVLGWLLGAALAALLRPFPLDRLIIFLVAVGASAFLITASHLLRLVLESADWWPLVAARGCGGYPDRLPSEFLPVYRAAGALLGSGMACACYGGVRSLGTPSLPALPLSIAVQGVVWYGAATQLLPLTAALLGVSAAECVTSLAAQAVVSALVLIYPMRYNPCLHCRQCRMD